MVTLYALLLLVDKLESSSEKYTYYGSRVTSLSADYKSTVRVTSCQILTQFVKTTNYTLAVLLDFSVTCSFKTDRCSRVFFIGNRTGLRLKRKCIESARWTNSLQGLHLFRKIHLTKSLSYLVKNK